VAFRYGAGTFCRTGTSSVKYSVRLRKHVTKCSSRVFNHRLQQRTIERRLPEGERTVACKYGIDANGQERTFMIPTLSDMLFAGSTGAERER
jgi:hypothetical protein